MYLYEQSSDELSDAYLERYLLKITLIDLWENFKSQQNEIQRLLTDNQPLNATEAR